ncbi:MAG: hypothetical protein F6K40_20645 [Okeania sp. SIO3I5]|uniref:hypothetical protein n=1 Tax=Okeania sp. SIO3I5 TaxID=2607805 RepID=UPI0013B65CEC|nr:hypothetical protein [Okeania sp. SIO3I5]NEQ38546.1 hypothetical protein [Okeania sp. SIO3I5]
MATTDKTVPFSLEKLPLVQSRFPLIFAAVKSTLPSALKPLIRLMLVLTSIF